MDGDIELTVEHAAPVLLRGRRGAMPTLGLAPVRTKAAIRRVRPSEMDVRLRPRGRWVGGHDELGMALFEGRLWIRLVDGAMAGAIGTSANAGRWPMTPERLAAHLSSPTRSQDRRLALLSARPWTPAGQAGVFEQVAVAEPAPAALALDLRDAASVGMARRVADLLVHDGTQSWIAIPPPVATARDGGTAVLVHDTVTAQLPDLPGTLPDAVDRYIDYLVRTAHGGRLPRATRDGIREAADKLRDGLPGYAPPPLADIAACLRILAMRTVGATRSAVTGHREAAEAAAPHLAGLMPYHARASADLLGADDLAEVADRVAACAAAVVAARTDPEAKKQSLRTLAHAGAYVDAVARPRLRAAVPTDDGESLAGLAP